jgi:aerobic carbon-monoxide dehydrogenase medium subunit
METALAASFIPDAIKDITIPGTGLNSNIHAAADYPAALMACRAVAACG